MRQKLVQCGHRFVFGGENRQVVRLEPRGDIGLRNRGDQRLACRLCEIRGIAGKAFDIVTLACNRDADQKRVGGGIACQHRQNL